MKNSSNGGMLVVVILVIIALGFWILFILEPIFFPHTSVSAHETCAVFSLKTLVTTETVWKQQGPDCNDKKDFWTYDLSCLYRMYRPDGETKAEFIDLAFARADKFPASIEGGLKPFGNLTIENWTPISTTLGPKSGYYYQAMLRDEDGRAYNQNEVGTNKIKATNDSKFAFMAYPDVYGATGIRTFIVNEAGTIYDIDPGSDENKIVLQWPGPDPTKVKGPGGDYWRVAE